MTTRVSASAPLDFDDEIAPASPGRTALSFEVIPPRHTENRAADEAKIGKLLHTLAGYRPDYIAVTSSQRSGWLHGTAEFIAEISRTT
ncbi:MAG: methylenetetrahydrofolate reductase, partial [Microbacteriaceae bacterium]|nr:methylenetetrahydrofolate reductase [Microbacteriaceae bacterium]